MSKGRRAIAIGLLSSVVSAAVIVVILGPGSTPQSRFAAARPSDELLPAVWHDAPRAIPPLAWVDADGGPAGLADFAGTPTLLNLWATWCAPCVRELPMLDTLAGETKGALAVVALNQDRAGDTARRYWAERGFDNLALYLDPGLEAFGTLNVRGLPLTLIVDSEGREIGRLEGIAEWTAPGVVAFLKSLEAASAS